MTYSPVAHILNWLEAQQVAKEIRSIPKKYIGCPVLETMPNGSQWAGVIERMEWDGSIGTEGAWAVYVRYSDNGGKFGSWTDCNVLEITGSKVS